MAGGQRFAQPGSLAVVWPETVVAVCAPDRRRAHRPSRRAAAPVVVTTGTRTGGTGISVVGATLSDRLGIPALRRAAAASSGTTREVTVDGSADDRVSSRAGAWVSLETAAFRAQSARLSASTNATKSPRPPTGECWTNDCAARRGPCESPARRPRPGPSRRQRSRACGRTPAREGWDRRPTAPPTPRGR
jgi:hypothetical protein